MVNLSNTASLSVWRIKGIGILRIVFGVIWAVDAWFKWQPISHLGQIGRMIIYLPVECTPAI